MTSTTGIRRNGRRRLGVAASLALVAFLALALMLTACGRGSESQMRRPSKPLPAGPQAEVTFPVTVTDDASRTVTIDAKPERLVSLAPANTEILFSLGLGDKVVGVTTYCDYPEEAKSKPKIGDFVSPNLEAIAAAKPDVVFATGGVQADVIAKLEALGAKVVVIDPQTFDGVRKAIWTVGQVTGEAEAALTVDGDIHAKLEEVIEAMPEGPKRVTAFIEIGQNPLFTAGPGTLLGDLVSLAYGENVVAESGYVAYSIEQLAKANPEVYLATKGSMNDPADVAKRTGYLALDAVKNGRVYALEDNLVARPGPRIGDGLLTVAKALHPDWFEK